MEKKSSFLRWVIPILLVAAIAGGLFWHNASSAPASAPATAQTTASATPAQADSASSDILATGTLRSSQNVSLSWKTSGKVAEVLVKKGDQVQKNQILATLDPASNVSFASIQASLLAAQQTLASLQDVAVAQATARVALINAQIAVTDAQNSLDALYRLPSQAAIDAWKAVYLKDESRIEPAQENYDYWVAYEFWPHCDITSTPGGPGGGPGGAGNLKCRTLSDEDLRIMQANAKAALETATETAKKDLAYLTYLQNYIPDPTLLSMAETRLAVAKENQVVAQANYDAAMKGPSRAEIAVAQANIDALQASLDQQYIRAPFAGTITDLDVKAGDIVNGGTYALRIDNLSSLYIDLQVSEVDIISVKVGQAVALSFDAFPDKTYTATVTQIAMIGTVSGGVANFTVTAVMDGPDSSLKSGMTAVADIVVSK